MQVLLRGDKGRAPEAGERLAQSRVLDRLPTKGEEGVGSQDQNILTDYLPYYMGIHFQQKTFHVVYRHVPAAFTMDWTDGFLLKPFASPNYHFVYAFSQLKSSRDDGTAKLTLLFQEGRGAEAEMVEHVSLRGWVKHTMSIAPIGRSLGIILILPTVLYSFIVFP